MNRILVVGAPRSGTTWVSATFAATRGSRLLHEPDNRAFNAKASDSALLHGGYPVLHPGQRAPEYERLWDPAFREMKLPKPRLRRIRRVGHRAGGEHPTAVVAKSVFAAFALDWLVERYSPRIVLIERNPIDVVSSWMRLGFEVGDLATREPIRAEYVERLGLPAWDPAAPRLLQVSWAVGLLMSAMHHQSRTRPDWQVVSYETLSRDRSRLRALAASVGLSWSDEAEASARHPAEPQNYAQDERGAATDFLSRFPELASWFEVENRV